MMKPIYYYSLGALLSSIGLIWVENPYLKNGLLIIGIILIALGFYKYFKG